MLDTGAVARDGRLETGQRILEVTAVICNRDLVDIIMPRPGALSDDAV